MEKGKTGSVRMPNNFDIESMDDISRRCISIMSTAVDYRNKNLDKLYFAGPWFDEKSALFYNTCEKIAEELKEEIKYSIYYPKNEVNKTPLEAFKKNVNRITEADAIVAFVSKKDVGTAWEIGMAYALGKPVYLLGYDKTTFLSHTNVMLAFTGSCFTLDKYAKFLTKGLDEDDYVKINNEWDGIE